MLQLMCLNVYKLGDSPNQSALTRQVSRHSDCMRTLTNCAWQGCAFVVFGSAPQMEAL